jgi:hypothetical protein
MKSTIRRAKNGHVIVEGPGKLSLAQLEGVECLNPKAPEEERRYRKVFVNKPIYLPKEYDRAVAEVLHGKDVVVLGMNGYSYLTPQLCASWGVKPGAYEAACESIMDGLIEELLVEFPGVDIRIVHGASDMGVDRAIIRTAHRRNRPQLGFNCPGFMFYVLDDKVPVYVAATQEEYSDAFVKSLNILIAANGRKQSFEHDINAALRYKKDLITLNVLKAISTTGGPPAINEHGQIEDAVAALEMLVHMVTANSSKGPDAWKEMLERVNSTTVAISRRLLSPERAFGKRIR